MLEYYQGNREDINHSIKVHSIASNIGRAEGLDEEDQDILEIAAIVHDIACPLCREKYGSAPGNLQEKESEALLEEFLEEFDLPEDILNRVIYIVSHHHSPKYCDGLDFQILLEADYLVNAHESIEYANAIQEYKNRVFKTPAGLQMLASMYPDLLEENDRS